MMTDKIVGGVISLLALLVGLTWMLGSRAKARLAAKYPPPGQMVDVGGYRLHINCHGEAGAGSPTVVMEGGNAEPCLTWASVQPEVARITRVCAYDRAGLGWSERSPRPRTVANITDELGALLAGAGVEPPYVLVGHSIGGMFARFYAYQHPEQVAGMVLVDSAHEEQFLRMPESVVQIGRRSQKMMAWLLRLLGWLNSMGLLALFAGEGHGAWPTPIPDPVRTQYLGVIYAGTKFFETSIKEAAAVQGNLAAVRAAKISTLGDIPLVVLSAGRSPIAAGHGISAEDVERVNVVMAELPDELAALSPRGKRVVAEHSGHYIHVEQPELVITAIREVVEAARR
jgi:pimeloyl-ACP methyl ester carboxylesterase